MKIGIVGAGFVGLSLAAVMSNKGLEVLVADSDLKKADNIRRGIAPFYERNLDSYLKKEIGKNLAVASSLDDLVRICKTIFITVGTPLRKGEIDLTHIKTVANDIGRILKFSAHCPAIVIKSTVIPGTHHVVKKILEEGSSLKEGHGFDLLANPEFLREGRAIEDTENPHLIVIGANSKQSATRLKRIYDKACGKPQYMFTNPPTAEMIKYANNAFLATKISFINQMASICQSIPGTNIDKVAEGIGIDPRIGRQFLVAGPGYGGSCLPKDLQALISYSSQMGKKPLLLDAVKKINDGQLESILKFLELEKAKIVNKRISVLGLAFKDNTDDIRDSVSIRLIRRLLRLKYSVTVHDPLAMGNTKNVFKDQLQYGASAKKTLQNSECVIIMVSWKQYERLSDGDFSTMKNRLVIDACRILLHKKLSPKYYALGVGETRRGTDELESLT